ncbi:hypothetical protein cyc_01400 [Cyclospora cayetanensis]|uniref:Transmembrane protein n=1 Tax=Cyclospora cayetanensis TaxID=88456 RepID=A0A1D3D8L4_9EIME|nr:hypothetical protein cyc_01400 [Cyclospora cayetanensis]
MEGAEMGRQHSDIPFPSFTADAGQPTVCLNVLTYQTREAEEEMTQTEPSMKKGANTHASLPIKEGPTAPHTSIPISSPSPSLSATAHEDYNACRLAPNLGRIGGATTPLALEHCASPVGSLFKATILHMDHRRLRRQLNGVRTKRPQKRVLLMCCFCVFLLAGKTAFIEKEEGAWKFGLALHYGRIEEKAAVVAIILFLCFIVILSRRVSRLSIQWGVEVTYLFVLGTFAYTLMSLCIFGRPVSTIVVQHILAAYLILEVAIFTAIRILILAGPTLARKGWWCCCTEHLRLIQHEPNCVIYSSFVWQRPLRVGDLLSPLFGEEPAQRVAEIWEASLRMGLWVHGIPVGPFVSQEVGSGSLFVSARVGFCYSHLDASLPSMASSSRILFGVTTTETSISGRFFRGLPRTRFLDPEAARLLLDTETDGCLPEIELQRLLSSLLRKRVEECHGFHTPQSCLRLLQHHMHMQLSASCAAPETENALEVHIDRHTKGICIPGYEYVGRKKKGLPQAGGAPAEEIPYQVLIVCSNRQKGLGASSKTTHRQRRQTVAFSPATAGHIASKVKFHGGIADSHEDEGPWHSKAEENEKIVRNQRHSEEVASQHSVLEVEAERAVERLENRLNRSVGNCSKSGSKSAEAPTAALQLDNEATWSWCDEEWQRNRALLTERRGQLLPLGWQEVGSESDTAVIYIHGFNVTLEQACSQLAHLFSFARMPSYLLPFVFSWKGVYGGPLSMLGYAPSKKTAEHRLTSDSFREFLLSLNQAGIRKLHLISHSAGARVLHAGLAKCVDTGAAAGDKAAFCSVRLVLFTLKYPKKSTAALLARRLTLSLQASDLQMSGILELLEETTPQESRRDSRERPRLLRVQSITMLNPDFPLAKFLETGYSLIRSLCSFISIYGDTRDQALAFSELYNRELCMGKRLFCFRSSLQLESSRSRNKHPKKIDLKEEGKTTEHKPPEEKILADVAPSLVAEDTAGGKYTGREVGGERESGDSNWLDIDIIDTTFVEGHIDLLKVSVGGFNRWRCFGCWFAHLLIDERDVENGERRRLALWEGSLRLRRGHPFLPPVPPAPLVKNMASFRLPLKPHRWASVGRRSPGASTGLGAVPASNAASRSRGSSPQKVTSRAPHGGLPSLRWRGNPTRELVGSCKGNRHLGTVAHFEGPPTLGKFPGSTVGQDDAGEPLISRDPSGEPLPTAELAALVGEGAGGGPQGNPLEASSDGLSGAPKAAIPSVVHAPSAQLYESGVCLEMDRLIGSCIEVEDVLQLLVSHRGALYVQNLVTAIKALAELTTRAGPQDTAGGPRMRGPQPPTWPRDGRSFAAFFAALSTEEAHAERIHSQRNEAEDLLRDPRYHLLLQDLRTHRRLLTFQAAAEVALSLRALRHPHYPLLSALIPPLTRGALPALGGGPVSAGAEDTLPKRPLGATHVLQMRQQIHLLLAVANVYKWAGYAHSPFFDRVARILMAAPGRAAPTLEPSRADAPEHPEGPDAAMQQGRVAENRTEAAHRRQPSQAPLGFAEAHSAGPPREGVSAAEVLRYSPSLLCASLRVLSSVTLTDARALGVLCAEGARGAPLASAADITGMSVAASMGAPRARETVALLEAVAEEVRRRPESFSLSELSHCVSSFRRALLHIPSAAASLTSRATSHLQLAARTRQRALLSPDTICTLLKDIVFFSDPLETDGSLLGGHAPAEASDPSEPHAQERPQEARCGQKTLTEPPLRPLLDAAVGYLEEGIDGITPGAAADAVFALSTVPGAPGKEDDTSFPHGSHARVSDSRMRLSTKGSIAFSALVLFNHAERYEYLLSFLFRKVGRDTSWEKAKEETFWIFLSQKILFPWLPHELHPRCVREGLRAWCVSRGGLGCPFPCEVSEASSLLRALGVQHQKRMPVKYSPYEADIVLRAADGSLSALLVTDDCARNSFSLCGGAHLLSTHLKHLGFSRVLGIPRGPWRMANSEGKKQILINRLAALEGATVNQQQRQPAGNASQGISSTTMQRTA